MRHNQKNWNVAEVKVSYKATHDRSVKINTYDDAHHVLRQMWDTDKLQIQEQFCVLFLNPAKEVLGFCRLHTGSTTEVTIDIKLLLCISLKMLAHSIIIAHNHPSGNTTVSKEDKAVTDRIRYATYLLDIELEDHIILTADTYVSLAQQGLIK